MENPPGSRRVVYLAAALLLVALAVTAVVVAGHTTPSGLASGRTDLYDGTPAPVLHARGWINSPALQRSDLVGKVVLYDFWTYSCINCVRTLPYIRAWYDRYKGDGLVVVGVHSPEFDFEKNHGNVARAAKRLGVTWPVALDDDHVIWDAFGVNFWPEKIVADRTGRTRYTHIGEGEYPHTENILRQLLGVKAGAPRARVPGAKPAGNPPTALGQITPETYLGTARGADAAHIGTDTYPEPASVPMDEARLAGGWTVDSEEVQATAAGSAVVLHYRAREVNLVMAVAGASVDVTLELDGKPLPATHRTSDSVVGSDGTTAVHVDASDLFRLVLAPGVEEHTLRIVAGGSGLQAYAFTFGA